MPHCAYGTCNSDSRYNHRDYMKDVYFIPFPKPELTLQKCKIWIHACGRKNFGIKNITQNTYICTKHFEGGMGPTKEHPHPIICSQVDVERKKRKRPSSRSTPIKKPKFTECLIEVNNNVNPKENIDVREELFNIHSPQHQVIFENVEIEEEPKFKDFSIQTTIEPNVVNKHVQTMGLNYVRKLFDTIEERYSATSITHHSTSLSPVGVHSFSILYNDCVKDPKRFKFLCGLSVQNFNVVFEMLGPDKMLHLKYKLDQKTPVKFLKKSNISDKDKLFIMLVKLRRGFTYLEMSYMSGVVKSTLCKVFYTWIQFMYLEFLSFKKIMFLSREQQKQKPQCFKKFKKLRVILDCTEIPIQSPYNFKEQGNTWSSYKHGNTVKFLVGIGTSGAITYVSDGFEGSISDRELFKSSDIMEHLDEGDELLFDRGFVIQDLLDKKKITGIMPPFLSGRDFLTPKEEIVTKDVANSRIHVERTMVQIKRWRILRPVVSNKFMATMTQIFYVCCCLVNFEPSFLLNKAKAKPELNYK